MAGTEEPERLARALRLSVSMTAYVGLTVAVCLDIMLDGLEGQGREEDLTDETIR